MKKQMTFRARQKKLKRQVRNDEWTRLMGNHSLNGRNNAIQRLHNLLEKHNNNTK